MTSNVRLLPVAQVPQVSQCFVYRIGDKALIRKRKSSKIMHSAAGFRTAASAARAAAQRGIICVDGIDFVPLM